MIVSQTDVLMVEHVLMDGNRFPAHVPMVSMAIYANQVNCQNYQCFQSQFVNIYQFISGLFIG